MLSQVSDKLFEVKMHEYGQTPDSRREAMRLALIDVMLHGVGHVSGVFDASEFWNTAQNLGPLYVGSELAKDLHLNPGSPLVQLVDVFRQFLNDPTDCRLGLAQLRRRSNLEGYHLDLATDTPGIRMLTQLTGSDSQLRIREPDFGEPKTIQTPYLPGSVLILPESVSRRLQYTDTVGNIWSATHREHTGYAANPQQSAREIVVADVMVGPNNFVDRLGIIPAELSYLD